MDTFKYCEHLKDFKITFISLDQGAKRMYLSNVNQIFIFNTGNKILNGLIFALTSLLYLSFQSGPSFIVYFEKCHILKKILFWKKMHLDIRTLSVHPNELIRVKQNADIQKAVDVYDTISVISNGVSSKLNIKTNKKCYLLPLGADIISTINKDFSELKLLYVGTLYNRNIYITLLGLYQFVKKNPLVNIKYDIVGDGPEKNILTEFIKEKSLEDIVTLHGWVTYTELKPFFDNSNIGISFVPKTDYYDFQPPTKTYEYILSGLFCIATSTHSNQAVINKANGYLIEDNSEDFCKALLFINQNKDTFNSITIRNSQINSRWECIVDEYLLPIILNQ